MKRQRIFVKAADTWDAVQEFHLNARNEKAYAEAIACEYRNVVAAIGKLKEEMASAGYRARIDTISKTWPASTCALHGWKKTM